MSNGQWCVLRTPDNYLEINAWANKHFGVYSFSSRKKAFIHNFKVDGRASHDMSHADIKSFEWFKENIIGNMLKYTLGDISELELATGYGSSNYTYKTGKLSEDRQTIPLIGLTNPKGGKYTFQNPMYPADYIVSNLNRGTWRVIKKEAVINDSYSIF